MNDVECAVPGPSEPESPAVAAAARYDAAGDHVAAVNRLAAAAAERDITALTLLGKRLLVGDRAPPLPNDGARLLEEAMEYGGAEAAAVVAVLYAVGASRGRGMAQALDALTLAAERGFEPAREQLRVLAAEHRPESARSDDWRELRSRVDLVGALGWPPSRDLSGAPLIRLVPGFLSPTLCRWLIDKARGRLTRAKVYEALSRRTTVSSTRTNTAATLNLVETDVVCVLVQARMAACAGIPFRQLEPLSVLHYAEGEEITEHYDFVDPNVPDYEQEIAARGQRVVTFLCYLNDDYEGGQTEFPEVGVRHKGRRGDAVFFVNALPDGNADVRTLHAGKAPLRGEKWIVSQFMRNRPTL
jgi:prolyl 4-hydroxylase